MSKYPYYTKNPYLKYFVRNSFDLVHIFLWYFRGFFINVVCIDSTLYWLITYAFLVSLIQLCIPNHCCHARNWGDVCTFPAGRQEVHFWRGSAEVPRRPFLAGIVGQRDTRGVLGGKLNLLPCFQSSISFHVVVAKLNVLSTQDLQ